MYLSPLVTSELFNGLKRHMTLMVHSAGSAIFPGYRFTRAPARTHAHRRMQTRTEGWGHRLALKFRPGLLTPGPCDCLNRKRRVGGSPGLRSVTSHHARHDTESKQNITIKMIYFTIQSTLCLDGIDLLDKKCTNRHVRQIFQLKK